MTKAEIVAEISRTTGIERDTVLAVVESFMEAVNGSSVTIVTMRVGEFYIF